MDQHLEKHFTSSDLVKDIVIGMSDGLTVPFALAAGLSGAVASNGLVITAGVAEIVAGSIAMGLGGYLAGKTEIEHYQAELKREYSEVETVPEREKEEIRDFFGGYGFDEQLQHEISEKLAKDKDKWVSFMMRFELGLEKPDERRATKSALNIGLAYVVGGIIPLLGYFITSTPHQGLILSALITIVCLLIFGFFKAKFTSDKSPFYGAVKTAFVGIIAAGCAYLIARMISA